jgi:cold shock CspA family protein
MQGECVSWKTTFGFIRPDSGRPNIFVHRSSIIDRRRCLEVDDVVEFEVRPTPRGPCCYNVEVIVPANESGSHYASR